MNWYDEATMMHRRLGRWSDDPCLRMFEIERELAEARHRACNMPSGQSIRQRVAGWLFRAGGRRRGACNLAGRGTKSV